jgi:hypothetical protein
MLLIYACQSPALFNGGATLACMHASYRQESVVPASAHLVQAHIDQHVSDSCSKPAIVFHNVSKLTTHHAAACMPGLAWLQGGMT